MMKIRVIGVDSMGKNHTRVYSELNDVERGKFKYTNITTNQ